MKGIVVSVLIVLVCGLCCGCIEDLNIDIEISDGTEEKSVVGIYSGELGIGTFELEIKPDGTFMFDGSNSYKREQIPGIWKMTEDSRIYLKSYDGVINMSGKYTGDELIFEEDLEGLILKRKEIISDVTEEKSVVGVYSSEAGDATYNLEIKPDGTFMAEGLNSERKNQMYGIWKITGSDEIIFRYNRSVTTGKYRSDMIIFAAEAGGEVLILERVDV